MDDDETVAVLAAAPPRGRVEEDAAAAADGIGIAPLFLGEKTLMKEKGAASAAAGAETDDAEEAKEEEATDDSVGRVAAGIGGCALVLHTQHIDRMPGVGRGSQRDREIEADRQIDR